MLNGDEVLALWELGRPHRLDFDTLDTLAQRTSAAHCAGSVPSRRTEAAYSFVVVTDPEQIARLAELWAVVANIYLVTLLRSGGSTVVEGHDTQCVSHTRWLGCVPKSQQKPGLLIGSLSPGAETAMGVTALGHHEHPARQEPGPEDQSWRR